MNHEWIVGQVNAYVDGDLSERSRRDVEAHVEACGTCRTRLASLQMLLGKAAALPRSIEPSRDLWPAIDARLADRAHGLGLPGSRSRRRRIRRSRGALAAATTLLIAVASMLIMWMAEQPDRDTAASGDRALSGQAGSATLAADWRMLEREYEEAAGELQEVLDVMGAELSPETRRIVEQNLRIIDLAIQESRAALIRDPANRELARHLSLAYERKLEMLTYVARL